MGRTTTDRHSVKAILSGGYSRGAAVPNDLSQKLRMELLTIRSNQITGGKAPSLPYSWVAARELICGPPVYDAETGNGLPTCVALDRA